jgi:hypothetical protein
MDAAAREQITVAFFIPIKTADIAATSRRLLPIRLFIDRYYSWTSIGVARSLSGRTCSATNELCQSRARACW